MNGFEHVHPPVPDKSHFQIKEEEEKKKNTNIFDDSAKKPSRSFGFSFVSHAVLLLVLLCVGLKQPEETDPVVIEMSMVSSEDEISLDLGNLKTISEDMNLFFNIKEHEKNL